MKALLIKSAAAIEGFLLPFGFWGLGGIAFLNSSFVPLPHAIDVLVITLSLHNPDMMLAYAGVATLGSTAGGFVLYQLADRAGHAVAERKVGKERMARIRAWFEKYEFLTIFLPSITPPPTPFKAFIITAGVIEVQTRKFLLSLLLGRSVRHFTEAYLAVHFGERVWRLMIGNGPLVVSLIIAAGLLAWIAKRVAARSRPGSGRPRRLAPMSAPRGQADRGESRGRSRSR